MRRFHEGRRARRHHGPGNVHADDGEPAPALDACRIQARVQFARQGRPVFRQHAAVRRQCLGHAQSDHDARPRPGHDPGARLRPFRVPHRRRRSVLARSACRSQAVLDDGHRFVSREHHRRKRRDDSREIRRVGAGFRDGLSRARSPGGRRGQQDVFVLRHPFHERRRRERLPSRRSGAAYRRAVRHCPRAQGHGFVPGIPERPRLARCGEARRRPCGIGRRRRPWGGIMAERLSSASPPVAQKADEHADTAQIAQALRELKALVDEGILSQGEFEAKKKHLLGL